MTVYFGPIDGSMDHELEYDELEEVLDAYAASKVDWNPEPSPSCPDVWDGPCKTDGDPD